MEVSERTRHLAQANRQLSLEVAQRRKHEAALLSLNQDLQKNMRELKILYDICRRRLVPRDEDQLLKDVVTLLPKAWEEGSLAGASIDCGDRVFHSPHFDQARVTSTPAHRGG